MFISIRSTEKNYPPSVVGICTDRYNNLYIACNQRVRKINTSTNIINTIAGNLHQRTTGLKRIGKIQASRCSL